MGAGADADQGTGGEGRCQQADGRSSGGDGVRGGETDPLRARVAGCQAALAN